MNLYYTAACILFKRPISLLFLNVMRLGACASSVTFPKPDVTFCRHTTLVWGVASIGSVRDLRQNGQLRCGERPRYLRREGRHASRRLRLQYRFCAAHVFWKAASPSYDQKVNVQDRMQASPFGMHDGRMGRQ